MNYTIQFADGTGSNPGSQAGLIANAPSLTLRVYKRRLIMMPATRLM